jgi:hypothetical protein
MGMKWGHFLVWRPNLDELDVDSAPASAFLILKSFRMIPLQLSCRVPVRVLACLLLLSDGPVLYNPFEFLLQAHAYSRPARRKKYSEHKCAWHMPGRPGVPRVNGPEWPKHLGEGPACLGIRGTQILI